MLDFRLETFLTVCDTMNYSKSAELLHITQPAVTHHIQHLESVYQCKLFLYEGRRLQKTEAACLLEKYARSMRLSEETLQRTIHNTRIQKLSVGATKTIGECVIGTYAEHFIACPDNELTLVVDNTQRLLEMLDRCDLDFAMIEGNFDHRKYGHELYSLESFVGICAPDHPFAGRKISLDELLQQTLICREEGSGTRAILENKLLDTSHTLSQFKRCICISSFSLILDFVKKGYGISFVYEVLAKQAGLATFTLESGSIQREFNFVFLKNTGAEEKFRQFIGK